MPETATIGQSIPDRRILEAGDHELAGVYRIEAERRFRQRFELADKPPDTQPSGHG